MEIYRSVISIVIFATLATNSWGQFYTIEKDEVKKNPNMNVLTNNTVDDDEQKYFSYRDSVLSHQKVEEDNEDMDNFFNVADGHEIFIEKDIPVFVSMKDSLLFGLIKQRMDVCLPLDFISVNSRYGYRSDPFSKCKKFHDGIDLKAHYQHVYSMLPGIVTQVVYSNKGYGNHVVMDYGDIQVLYGHMSAITVRQGDKVLAGTIVGISGSTGKSSGPHLHIKISAHGKSLDPTPFIGYLNRYITRLQDRIAYLRFGERPPQELNIENLYAALRKYNVMYPKIVVAQAIIETGYFSSNACLNYNNLFGLRRPSNGQYYRFENWEQSVKAYKDYIQYKYKGGDYFRFLDRIGYAEDPYYISKVRSICNSL